MVGEHAAEKLVGPADSATDRGHEPQRGAKLFGRQNIAEDQVGNLKHRAGRTLQETPQIESCNIGRQHRDNGSHGHCNKRVDQNFSAPGMVAVSSQNDSSNSADQEEQRLRNADQ